MRRASSSINSGYIYYFTTISPKCRRYDTQDALYDVAWSEIHENQLVTASGDGSIKLWDTMINVSAIFTSRPVAWPTFMTLQASLGPPHTCMARTLSGSVLRRLVEPEEGRLHFIIVGRHRQASMYHTYHPIPIITI